MTRYKRARGKIFISGNTNMPNVPHELSAIEELGLVAFFLPPKWNNWRFPRKTALIFAWMERIISQAQIAKSGTLYRIPNDWREEATLLVIPSPGPLKLQMKEHPFRDARPRTKPSRKRSIDDGISPIPDLFHDTGDKSYKGSQ